MTRLAILADIHGNLAALEAVLDDAAAHDIDYMIAAGDIVNWGPSSAAVLERLARVGCAMLRGNNEYYLLDYNTPRAPDKWNGYVMLPWLHAQLNGAWHWRIAAWPDQVSLRYPDAPPVRIEHGWPGNPWYSIFPQTPDAEIEEKLAAAGVEETTFICAHTHLPLDRRVGRWHILNPGSVGLPLDGIPGIATYMLVEGTPDGWEPAWRRAPFDIEKTLAALAQSGLVEACGLEGELVIEEFQTARLRLSVFHEWRRRTHPDAPLSPELVEQFRRLDTATYWAHTMLPYHLNLDL
ncbi:MAG: metallophosphoesterase family protein [Anaerolineae bacterium]|nr:metallophosphoesterase family protein [Anaerolineae bacterium]